MKAREAEFTETETIRVFCGTWNVNCKPPKENLKLWLDEQLEPDIYVIGFQEVDMSANALLLSNVKASAPWEDAIQFTLGYKYAMVISKQLVGVMMMIFVKTEHIRHMHDLRFSIVGCGLLGVMGNKGGIAVRFGLYDSTFCFVNSHLAAQMDHVERRNQDYRELVRRINFPPNTVAPELSAESVTPLSAETLTIWDHDHLFWLGDLNYRISLPDIDVKQRIEMGDFDYLLEHDQLILQKKRGAAFAEFEEGKITFAPTYRYDAGTDRYDTSEKKRTPAWCDRVQWRGADIKLLRYDRCVELRASDHKPVTGLFLVKIRKVIPEKKLEQQLQVMHLLDKLENDNMPDAAVNTNTLLFADVRCGIPQTRSFTLANTGQVLVNFSLVLRPGETAKHKPWVSIKPEQGLLLPGEQVEIEVEVNVDAVTGLAIFRGEPLDDILILRIDHGKDIFVLVTGNYLPSCFGATLEMLCAPVPSVGVRQVHVPGTLPMPLRVPSELVRIVDYIYARGMDEKGLFTTFGEPHEMALIREYLDNGIEFAPPFRCDIHSMAETMIRFVGSLAEPVIPFRLYRTCLAAADNPAECKRIVMQLPHYHRNAFVYLIAFLREVLRHSSNNTLTAQDLAVVFGNEMLRAQVTGRGAQRNDDRSDAGAQQRRAMFMLNFLQ